MNNPLTHKYLQYLEQERRRLLEELKRKLTEATYETDREVLSQFNLHVNDLCDQLFSEERDGSRSTSWFKKKVVEKFSYDKGRYKEGFQVDGFIENMLPEIRQDFRLQWERADENSRTAKYFDHDLALDPDPDPIIWLLARHAAYFYFFDHKKQVLHEAIETLQKEKHLAAENHFNDLSPIGVLAYIEQLQQTNQETKEPFLTAKQVYNLTNMICRNQPVTEPVKVNISDQQRRQLEVFFIIFYKYCKDTVDAKGNRERYISLLSRYIAQFQDKTIYANNFYLKEADQPLLIKVDAKYLRWMNA